MPPKLPLPRGWKRRVRSAVLHILALGTTACPHQLEPRARRSVAGSRRVRWNESGMPARHEYLEHRKMSQ
jgi:hypothetical protein